MMNLVGDDSVGFQALVAREKFFLETWFGMTH